MTKDFAKNSSKDRSRNATRSSQPSDSATNSIKPFISGSLFGVLFCLGAQWLLSNNSRDLNPEILDDIIAPEIVSGPVLDFYTRLREVEVLVPDEDISLASKNVVYLLQAGSFRDAADADSMRVNLILLNLDAEISKFNHNGEIWHRVIVGPFSERTNMARTRTTLLENGIESLLLTQVSED